MLLGGEVVVVVGVVKPKCRCGCCPKNHVEVSQPEDDDQLPGALQLDLGIVPCGSGVSSFPLVGGVQGSHGDCQGQRAIRGDEVDGHFVCLGPCELEADDGAEEEQGHHDEHDDEGVDGLHGLAGVRVEAGPGAKSCFEVLGLPECPLGGDDGLRLTSRTALT